jgi:predicted nucleic acid-binding protein
MGSMPVKHKVFLDTSVFLASLRSPQGGSSELLRHAVVGSIQAFVSDDVMDEVARHIQKVAPGLRSLLLRYLSMR